VGAMKNLEADRLATLTKGPARAPEDAACGRGGVCSTIHLIALLTAADRVAEGR
jgi:hypothetical protein